MGTHRRGGRHVEVQLENLKLGEFLPGDEFNAAGGQGVLVWLDGLVTSGKRDGEGFELGAGHDHEAYLARLGVIVKIGAKTNFSSHPGGGLQRIRQVMPAATSPKNPSGAHAATAGGTTPSLPR